MKKSILTVDFQPEQGVAILTLDAPPFNIVTMPTRQHLADVFGDIEMHPDIRVVIIQSKGDHFSSGGDIAGFLEADPEDLTHLADNMAAPERSSKPVIARLTGYTFGVGLEIALACDFRIASSTTILSLPEMRLGMIPGSGGTQRVARLAGIGRAKDMIMRARRIGADEALAWGLLTEVVSSDQLDQHVANLVEQLLGFSPLAQKMGKQAINQSDESSLHSGLLLEGQMYGFLRNSEDFQEGVRAFQEKRRPRFHGK